MSKYVDDAGEGRGECLDRDIDKLDDDTCDRSQQWRKIRKFVDGEAAVFFLEKVC